MNLVNRSLLILITAFAACITAGCAQHQEKTVEVVAIHARMHNALRHLHEARQLLEEAEEIFRGHRAEALEHTDRAIQQVIAGLQEQGEQPETGEVAPMGGFESERFPHMRRALARLREARGELTAADKVFGGHRDAAIEQANLAIHQIEEALDAAAR